jgi:hypothetical protein
MDAAYTLEQVTGIKQEAEQLGLSVFWAGSLSDYRTQAFRVKLGDETLHTAFNIQSVWDYLAGYSHGVHRND